MAVDLPLALLRTQLVEQLLEPVDVDALPHLHLLTVALLMRELEEVVDAVPRCRQLDQDRGRLPGDRLGVRRLRPVQDCEDVLPHADTDCRSSHREDALPDGAEATEVRLEVVPADLERLLSLLRDLQLAQVLQIDSNVQVAQR